ncbi:MAG: hypothetical protein K9M97_10440 [Akkermansiaceae bacterium]|nr:hypothetical protein [Akkermansiaceae bacterium]
MAITFGVLWALSAVLWMGSFGFSSIVIVLPPIAPLLGGFAFPVNGGNFEFAIISLVISTLTISATVFSISRCRALGTAKALIVLYWFWSLFLLGLSV